MVVGEDGVIQGQKAKTWMGRFKKTHNRGTNVWLPEEKGEDNK